MTDQAGIAIELQHKVNAVLEDEERLGVYSTSEQLAVALILNRADLLEDLNHTMLEAMARIGPEWLAAAYKVEQWHRG